MRRLLTSFILILFILPTFAYDVEINGIYYNEKSSLGKTVKVTSAPSSKPYSGFIVIPATISVEGTTYKVVEVEDSAFNNCSGITALVIGKNVTHVGINAFNKCTSLSQLVLEDGEEDIKFEYSRETKFNEIKYIQYEERYSHFYYSPLKSIYIGRHVVPYINSSNQVTSPFQSNNYIESVEFGNAVKSVGLRIFWNCTNINDVKFGNNITQFENYAFSSCNKITDISLPANTKIIGESVFSNCDLREINIPSSVDSIAKNAFMNNYNLKKITFEENPNLKLGTTVFTSGTSDKIKCTEVWTKTKKPIDLPEINYAFCTFANQATLYVPRNCVDAYKSAKGWKNFKEIIVDPNDPDDIQITEIKLDKFYITLEEGKEYLLNATILPEDATNKELSWSTSNESVATVANGKVKAIKEGAAVISAQSTDGSNVSASCMVSVLPQTSKPGDLNGDGIVDIADVNAVIDMILGLKEASAAADVNGDGAVDVADMNAVINIILGL